MGNTEASYTVRTACPAHCGLDACGINAYVENGNITRLEPADFPDPKYRRICLRGLNAAELVYHPDRLRYPLKRTGLRGEGKFERISWDEAIDTIADCFRDIASRYGWRAVGWILGGPGSGTTKFGAYLKLASLTHSTRVSTWGYGDAALPCGSRAIFGTHVPYELLAGWDKPELIVVWGSNPAEASPLRKMRRIMDLREQGTQVIVIDPRFTVTAARADDYLPLRPGTDGALALGLIRQIFSDNTCDTAFIRRHTTGPYLVRRDNGKYLRYKDINPDGGDEYMVWVGHGAVPASAENLEKAALEGNFITSGIGCAPSLQMLRESAEPYNPEYTSGICGVPAEIVVKLAARFTTAKPVSIQTHMGFSRSYHGDLATRGIATLAAITGNISLGAAAGHRPVMLNWKPFLEARPGEPSYERLGVLQSYQAAAHGKPFPLKAAYFANINFLNQCADSNLIVKEVFPGLEFIVATDLFMTTSARYADIILPAASFLEFSDLIYGPFPFLQLQQQVIPPRYESRSDADIAAALAEKLGYGDYFQGGEEGLIRELLDSKHESMKGITYEKLQQGAVRTSPPPSFDESKIKLSTPSGKIEFYSENLTDFQEELPVYREPLEKPRKGKYPLSFIQGHSRFRTHSSYGNIQPLLDMNPEPLLEIHPDDAVPRSIKDNDMVTVYNQRGRVTLKARITASVRPGVVNIMQGWWPDYFKEGHVNCLTHARENPSQSYIFEPNMAFNDVAVEVKPAEVAV